MRLKGHSGKSIPYKCQTQRPRCECVPWVYDRFYTRDIIGLEPQSFMSKSLSKAVFQENLSLNRKRVIHVVASIICYTGKQIPLFLDFVEKSEQ